MENSVTESPETVPLSFANATIRKFETPVLHDIDWTVGAGEQWMVTGGNGSGKTTLLETIAGKWALSRGKLLKKGVVEFVASDFTFNRIIRASAQYYQQRYYSQDAEIAPTVREVLTGRLKPVGTVREDSVVLPPSSVTEEQLTSVADLLALHHLLDHPFVTLSNGETRRMLLALSLFRSPDILLLDFPFIGLDVRSREVLNHALSELAARGVCVILSTSPADIPPFVTHVLELDKGRVGWQGTVSDFRLKKSNLVGKTDVPLDLLRRLGEPRSEDFDYVCRLRNVSVVYDGRAVLDKVSWSVAKGEKWALSGPNGSGKSTLLSILTADHPQRFANDYDIFGAFRGGRNKSIWDIKRRIGHVSPELHLYFPVNTTVFKAIASGFFDATGVYFTRLTEAQVERVRLVAGILEVEMLLEKDLRYLSRGEQRLVFLARALVKNPPLLILDEPCQGLDVSATERFKSVVDAICASGERTLIYVSHYTYEIPSCVTKFIRLNEGRVEEVS